MDKNTVTIVRGSAVVAIFMTKCAVYARPIKTKIDWLKSLGSSKHEN